MRHMTQELGSVDKYNSQGYEILEQVIPEYYLDLARSEAYRLKELLLDIMDQPAEWGQPQHWLGLEMASKYSNELYALYTSSLMYDIAHRYLGDNPYLYNDQVVVKKPLEDFAFEPHYDNQYNNPRNIQTMNALWILDDQNKYNGNLWVKDKLYKIWMPLYPKAGDIVLLDGNTYHASGDNITDMPRGAYACVYSSENMEDERYYTEPFDSI